MCVKFRVAADLMPLVMDKETDNVRSTIPCSKYSLTAMGHALPQVYQNNSIAAATDICRSLARLHEWSSKVLCLESQPEPCFEQRSVVTEISERIRTVVTGCQDVTGGTFFKPYNTALHALAAKCT